MGQTNPHTARLRKQALAHPARQGILGHLMGSAEPMREGDLARMLDLAAAKVTYHLTVLREAALIVQADEGQDQGERVYLAAGLAGR